MIKNHSKYKVNYNNIWKEINKLQSLNKIKNLIWKMHHNIIIPRYYNNSSTNKCNHCNKINNSVNAVLSCKRNKEFIKLIRDW